MVPFSSCSSLVVYRKHHLLCVLTSYPAFWLIFPLSSSYLLQNLTDGSAFPGKSFNSGCGEQGTENNLWSLHWRTSSSRPDWLTEGWRQEPESLVNRASTSPCPAGGIFSSSSCGFHAHLHALISSFKDHSSWVRSVLMASFCLS